MKNPHTVVRSVWMNEDTGKPTRKTYWQATCDLCGGFIAASITRNVADIAAQAATSAAYHRYICDAVELA